MSGLVAVVATGSALAAAVALVILAPSSRGVSQRHTVAAVSTTAPAHPVPTPDPRGAIMPPAFSEPLVPGEVRYREARVRIRPPERGGVARIDAGAAVRSYVESGIRSDLAHSPRSVVLARFTDFAHGPEDAQGRVVPLYDDVLSWVITVRNAPVVWHHHPRNGQRLPDGRCDFVYVVDAVTGEPITAFQACGRIE